MGFIVGFVMHSSFNENIHINNNNIKSESSTISDKKKNGHLI